MYPAQFEYHTPGSVKEALDLLGRHKDDAKLLAGGHSLLPAMKLRLAQPKHLVDLRKVSGLKGIKEDGGSLVIGAMTTHYEVETSSVVNRRPDGAQHGDDRRQPRPRGPGGGLPGRDHRARC
jgi:carbon-monoxide dehydrogenase medium subunit